MKLNELEKSIIEDRCYGSRVSINALVQKYGKTAMQIRKLFDSDLGQAYREEVITRHSKTMRGDFKVLAKASMVVMRKILRTDHVQPVFDKEGVECGKKIDVNILKIKKEVAERVLEEVGVVEPVKKGGGIVINNTKGGDNNQTLVIEEKRKETKQLLELCKLDKDEDNPEYKIIKEG